MDAAETAQTPAAPPTGGLERPLSVGESLRQSREVVARTPAQLDAAETALPRVNAAVPTPLSTPETNKQLERTAASRKLNKTTRTTQSNKTAGSLPLFPIYLVYARKHRQSILHTNELKPSFVHTTLIRRTYVSLSHKPPRVQAIPPSAGVFSGTARPTVVTRDASIRTAARSRVVILPNKRWGADKDSRTATFERS